MRKGGYLVYNGYTGEGVNLVRKVCTCGHVLTFLTNRPKICNHCSRTVYPTKECEFKEKIKKEMRKKK